MSGGLLKIIAWLLVIAMVAGVGTLIFVAFMQPPANDAAASQDGAAAAFRSVSEGVRSMYGRMRGQGQQLGRAVPGVDPPSVAERLLALSTAAASQSVVTPGQEVIMTGAADTSVPYSCLGAENEVMLEVKNDIEADQLDISYSMENLGETSASSGNIVAARVVKVASCGPRSVVKQCIPLAPSGKGVRLHTLAYYYDAATDTRPSSIREESLQFPTLLDNATLKASPKLELNASAFKVPSANTEVF